MVFVFNWQWFSIKMSPRRGNSFKSHVRLVEPGMKLRTNPWQVTYPTTPQKNCLWLSLGRNWYQTWEGLWFVCVFYDRSTQRLHPVAWLSSTESGSGELQGVQFHLTVEKQPWAVLYNKHWQYYYIVGFSRLYCKMLSLMSFFKLVDVIRIVNYDL